MALDGRGYVVMHAGNEAAALDVAARHPPRLAIVDTHLPARDPRTFVSSLRAIAPSMRIIFLADALPSDVAHRERVALMSESCEDSMAHLLRDALDTVLVPGANRAKHDRRVRTVGRSPG